MKRRTFLKSSVAALGLAPGSLHATTIGVQSRSAFVVITDLTESMSFSHVIAVLDVFMAHGIPVTCIVDPFDAQGNDLPAQSRLRQMLLGYYLGGSGIGLAAYVKDLASKSEYFQARAAFSAGNALRGILKSAQNMPARQGAVVQTIACAENEKPIAPTGVRSAGISNVLTIPTSSAPVRSETWPNGTVRTFGGQLIDLPVYSNGDLTVGSDASQNIYYLSARSFSNSSVSDVTERAERLAGKLMDLEVEGRLSLQSLADLQLRDDYDFQRLISLRLLEPHPDDTTNRQAFSQFSEMLRLLDIEFETRQQSRTGKQEIKNGYWLLEKPTESETEWPDGKVTILPIRIDTDAQSNLSEVRSRRALAAGTGIVLETDDFGPLGFDASGNLRLRAHDILNGDQAHAFSRNIGYTNDAVVTIHPNSIAHSTARRALFREIEKLKFDAVTKFLSIENMARALNQTGPIESRQRRTLAARPGLRRFTAPGNSSRRAALLEDAHIAWSYFKKYTNRQTGLCPATVNFAAAGEVKHKAITMWDAGSHINALIAAFEIGIIDKGTFESAVSRILPNIRGRKSQGRLLPQGWIRTDRHKWGNRNFDGCDAGRLLSSLNNLRRFEGFNDRLSELVSSWDLDKIIIDGAIHSVIDEELLTTYVSHCAHYSALAFRRWGLDVKSPYEVFANRSSFDGQIALLEAAAGIGPLGAEPLLLEAVELGMSPESNHLADVLYSTQMEEYYETGQLICVSEGPIDKKPWFTYQGLQLDAETRTWAIDTVGGLLEYRTEEFRNENIVVSAKAAYLWSACRPHDYADRLVGYVRKKARTDRGFSSSIFSNTGRATNNYTDLNTNAIILQAIAHILKTG